MAEFDPASVLHMLSAHEDRIQRLEAVTSDLATSVAEQNATMRAFSQQMRMLSDSVCQKLEDVSSRLSDKIGTITEISKEMVSESKDQEKRIQTLETQGKSDEKMTAFWLKIAYWVLTASAGSIGTILLQHFVK